MAAQKPKFETVGQYLDSLPASARKTLQQVRKAIKDAVPQAEEMISYQIPAFKLDGTWIFYYSAYTNHYSLSCPPPFTVFEEFKDALGAYKVSKSAIQFPLDEPVPVALIAGMAKFRAQSQKKKK